MVVFKVFVILILLDQKGQIEDLADLAFTDVVSHVKVLLVEMSLSDLCILDDSRRFRHIVQCVLSIKSC